MFMHAYPGHDPEDRDIAAERERRKASMDAAFEQAKTMPQAIIYRGFLPLSLPGFMKRRRPQPST